MWDLDFKNVRCPQQYIQEPWNLEKVKNARAKFKNAHPDIVEKISVLECMEKYKHSIVLPAKRRLRKVKKRGKITLRFSNLDIKSGDTLRETKAI